MIPTFVIFLREGVEASMIVAILLSYLDQIGQRRHFRDVFLGVGSALVLVLGGGIGAYFAIHQYSGSTVQTVFETITFLVAATVLTYMTFWMQAHSRTMSADLKRRSDEALEGRTRWGLGLLAFQAVGREGLETMVFTLAIVFASSSQAPTAARGHGLLLGAVLGLAVALAIAYVIFKLGKRLNLGLFFRVIGVVLMVFAAGLLADAVENMQQLGWLPFLDHVLWNTSSYLSEDSSIGDLFHSLLGYADQPTVLQFLVWVAYLAGATTAFLMLGHRQKASARQVRATVVESGDVAGTGVPTALVDAGVAVPSAPDAPVAASPEPVTSPDRPSPRT
jgi:high-affinity iron transporter